MPQFGVAFVVAAQCLNAADDAGRFNFVRGGWRIQKPANSSGKWNLRRADLKTGPQCRNHDPSLAVLRFIPFVERVNNYFRRGIAESA